VPEATALELQDVSKRFGPTVALSNVSASFLSHRIHVLMGANGAGKSTLAQIIGGFIRPDTGELKLNGIVAPLGDAAHMREAGVRLVHQHFMLIPGFTVAENIALDVMRSHRGRWDMSRTLLDAKKLAQELGWVIDFESETSLLPVGMQQRVEVLRALSSGGETLVLDEPTAVLSPQETNDLFRVLRILRDSGKTIVLILHKLSEVLAIADEVTVLRHGKVVGNAVISQCKQELLAHWMFGSSTSVHESIQETPGDVVFHANDLWVKGDRGENRVRGVDLAIRAGEIVGIGGVEGNGQSELAEAFAGIRNPAYGQLTKFHKSEIAYIPQDRQRDGLVGSMTVEENFLLRGQWFSEMWSGPFLRTKRLRDWTQKLVEKYQIRTENSQALACSLSGGNQQKAVLARNLDREPVFIVAVDPTRGLDASATTFVRQELVRAASKGAAIALFSTDTDEIMQMAHRNLWMESGQCLPAPAASVTSGESI